MIQGRDFVSGAPSGFGRSHWISLAALLLVAMLLVPGLAGGAGGDGVVASPDDGPLVEIAIISDVSEVKPGEPFWVALRQRIAPGWHTYWQNPGDSGEATAIAWSLPDGFTAGEVQWPLPEAIPFSGLTNYGYSDEVLLLAKIMAPTVLPDGPLTLRADVRWLVCADICIPEEGGASVTLDGSTVADALDARGLPDAAVPGSQAARDSIAAARERLPIPSPFSAGLTVDAETLTLAYSAGALAPERLREVSFFPKAWGLVDHAAPQPVTLHSDGLAVTLTRGDLKTSELERLEGVLVVGEDTGGGLVRQGFEISVPAGATTGLGAVTGTFAGNASSDLGVAGGVTGSVGGLGFLSAVLFAVIGGLILNLMPCVFPVLSLKAMALARHGGTDAGAQAERRRHALAYGAGVLASFAALALLLLALRASGMALGWGFQFQSPTFVVAMAALFFVLGLSLSGVVTLGGSGVQSVGSSLTAREGASGSFFTGVLASIAATPCTAPFMGAALGYALGQPAIAAFAVLMALGIGFAAPMVALGLSNTAARALPKPGPWMETLKQVLAFPLYATVVWLAWVLSQQAGPDGVLALGIVLTMLAFACWLWGSGLEVSLARGGSALAVALAGFVIGLGLISSAPTAVATGGGSGGQGLTSVADAGAVYPGRSTEPYSPERLAALRGEGRPVFINLTAAWCITCKVNERVVLKSSSLAAAYAEADVAYLVGDWTNRDDRITALLREHDRAGVPLYLFYPPSGEAVVLPQILTESLLLAQLERGADERQARADALSRN